MRSASLSGLVLLASFAIPVTASAQPADPDDPYSDPAQPAPPPPALPAPPPDAPPPSEAPPDDAFPDAAPPPAVSPYDRRHGPPSPPPLGLEIDPAAASAPAYDYGDPDVGFDGYPLAGYHGGRFYLRSRPDFFRIFPGVRLHIDSLVPLGKGVSDTRLAPTIILRRARFELGGELIGRFQFLLQGEFAPTAFENAGGTEQFSAAPAGVDPTFATAEYAPVQSPRYRAQPIHAYVNYSALPLLNVQVGQFNVPFTMNNRTSTNRITFMERSLASRAFGVPLVKDIGVMLWGDLEKQLLHYEAGVFQGDGQNRPNADNRGMTALRVFTRPLAQSDHALEKLQVGASFRYAMHDKNKVAYDYPSMSTQSGYRFWTPSYVDAVGTGRLVHVIPSGAQVGVAGELRVPYDRLDVRGEFVYLKNNTREGVDGFQSDFTERFGTMKGYAYYVTVGYWIFGKPMLTGDPGNQRPPRMDFGKPDPSVPEQAVELALKWEQLHATYESAARDQRPDANNIDGDIKVNALSAAANYWASTHIRLTLNYALNMFPDSAPPTPSSSGGPVWSSSQRALAPANRLPVGINDDARDTASTLHEVSARVAVAF